MRTGRAFWLAALIVACCLAGLVVSQWPKATVPPIAGVPQRGVEAVQPAAPEATAPSRLEMPLSSTEQPTAPSPAPATNMAAKSRAGAKANQAPAPNQPSNAGSVRKPPPLDPLARVALSLVGADREAEMYWYSAINDPSLPSEERKDLIEDLNEDGFEDPHHVTLNDLPLIVSRLQLIEEVAASAMDQVNADAFAEAYKDLVNMYRQLR